MHIRSLRLKNFRCFATYTCEFEGPMTVIEGANGTGKTSLLEALYYACYMRSFRTHIPKELLKFDTDAFFIQLDGIQESVPWEIQLGYAGTKRSIKINGKAAASYKEIVNLYRIISISEDDIFIIKGAPEIRRSFIDWALIITDPAYASLLRQYRRLVEQRNALLMQPKLDTTSYTIWTEQLLASDEHIKKKRQEFLHKLESVLNEHLLPTFGHFSVGLTYDSKMFTPSLEKLERIQQRTLWGAHLDDLRITLHAQASKQFASRGQQKLTCILLKLALSSLLNHQTIMLVDDFMTDFDQSTMHTLLALLATSTQQILLTTPTRNEMLMQLLAPYTPQHITL